VLKGSMLGNAEFLYYPGFLIPPDYRQRKQFLKKQSFFPFSIVYIRFAAILKTRTIQKFLHEL